jgi:uncharacterized protein YciI
VARSFEKVPRLLGRRYWLVRSTPVESSDAAQFKRHLDDHIKWLLRLEDEGAVFASGPLTSGPGVRPGAGVTVLRAATRDEAEHIAAGDPFVQAGLRTFEIFEWLVNEGSVAIRISLGEGTFEWD